MAQITGYICDVCGVFATNRDRWMKVVPYADNRHAEAGFDVCSNKCLVSLAKRRMEELGETEIVAPEGKRTRRQYSDEYKKEIAETVLSGVATVTEVAKTEGLHRGLVTSWVEKYQEV